MMKKVIFMSIVLGISLLAFSSCASQSFLVQGTPGTIISDGYNQQLAVLDDSGQATITLEREDGYYPYLLAQVPESGLSVPFALDYKNHNRGFIRGVGGTLFFSGAGIGLLGSLFLMIVGNADDDEETLPIIGTATLASGLALMASGLFVEKLGMPGASYNKVIQEGYDTGEKYDYDYQARQTTNSDILR